MERYFGTNDALKAIIEARNKKQRMLVVPITETTAKILVDHVGWSRGRKKRGRGKESYASSYDNLFSWLTSDCQKHVEDFAQKRNDAMHSSDEVSQV